VRSLGRDVFGKKCGREALIGITDVSPTDSQTKKTDEIADA